MRRLGIAAIVTGAWVVACSLIVPSELPDVKCASADPSACPSGMTCDLAAGRCITGAIIEPDSGDEDVVPPTDGGLDADGATDLAPLGASCVVDSDCKSGLCGTSTIMTTAIISGSSKPMCTATCCTSADCPSSFVCFSGGTGGSYCVPATKAGRVPPATGGKLPGAACGGSSECRSGLCEASKCVDTCCLGTDCVSGTVCRVLEIKTPAPSHYVWACAAPNSGGKDVSPGDAGVCSAQSDCKNDNCVGIPPTRVCTPSCCTAASCTQQGFAGYTCAYGSTTGNDQLKMCFRPGSAGGAVGSNCGFDSDCQSRYCDPELRKCAQLCCTDSDCASRAKCKPSKTGTPWLRCVPL